MCVFQWPHFAKQSLQLYAGSAQSFKKYFEIFCPMKSECLGYACLHTSFLVMFDATASEF